MQLPVSVFIIAKNEADRIPLTIRSVRDWVNEVVVVDSGSTDATETVSRQLGATFLFRAWDGYGPQKRYAESQCRNAWLLNLDADEEVSAALAGEIQALFARGEPASRAYSLRILALYPFQKALPRRAAGTKQIRLYRRDAGSFRDALVHDAVVLNPGVEAVVLNAPVIHRSFRSHQHAVEKINFYTDMQARVQFERGRNPSAIALIFIMPLAFLKCYVLRGYVFYGLDGVIHSWHYAYGRFLRMAKTRERFQSARAQDAGDR